MKRAAVTAAAAVLLLTGCSAMQDHEDARGRGDAPVANGKGDDSPATCTNMPDEFGNVCGKCVDGFPPYAVVSTTHYQSSSNIVLFQYPEKCGGAYIKGMPLTVPATNNSVAPPPEDES